VSLMARISGGDAYVERPRYPAEADVNPHEVLRAIDEHLRGVRCLRWLRGTCLSNHDAGVQAAIEQVQGDVRLERRFSPEFRNRIDEVVLFSPLRSADARQIATGYLGQLEHTV
jgi:hypothetical protein